MNHTPKFFSKMLMLVLCLMLMLTSCSLLPTELSKCGKDKPGSIE